MSQAQAKVELVALPVMQAMSFRVLCDYIFHPMSLVGQVPQEVVQGFEYLRKSVSSSGRHALLVSIIGLTVVFSVESQEKYGRWRAIAYGAMHKPEYDDRLANAVALGILRKLEDILFALLPAAANHDGRLGQRILAEFHTTATKVVLDAIKLQDKIQRVYVSHDYCVYLPTTNSHFSTADMESVDLGPDATGALTQAVRGVRGARGTVLLPVTPGLRATRVGQNLSSSDVVVKKACVVALL